MYESPDSNSKSFEVTHADAKEGNIPSIQRTPDTHEAAVTKQKEIDEQVNQTSDLSPFFANLMTLGMASQMQEGAENLQKGNYLKGSAQLATPLMFGEGLIGTAARTAGGLYGLANEEGVRKTYNLARQGNYGRAALSAAGDLFNAGMAYTGINEAKPYLKFIHPSNAARF